MKLTIELDETHPLYDAVIEMLADDRRIAHAVTTPDPAMMHDQSSPQEAPAPAPAPAPAAPAPEVPAAPPGVAFDPRIPFDGVPDDQLDPQQKRKRTMAQKKFKVGPYASQVSNPVTPAAAPAAAPEAAPAPAGEGDVRQAAETYMTQFGRDALISVLGHYGVQTITQLPAEQRDAFCTHLQTLSASAPAGPLG